MNLFLTILAATLGATCFSILFRVPRSYLPHTILLGLLTCLSIRFAPSHWTSGFSTFLVSLGTGVCAHILARFTGKPAQAFLIPAIIFLVPGTIIYRAFSEALAENTQESFSLVLNASVTSLAISFGLLLANWLIPSQRNL